ncbi:uncharacterized protein NESG_00471 [Nematocida ausubeli]|uniref:Uncharacterized protein n=1 Tax=Nematocida ausubeli (strain ATCC PRA-371 / ERTm2) TaxID=1913371 RepID=A0A086J5H5_NEMA1|nr:uncharacterized protein NESG_00471 [Nematocida ausubeli]KFG27393.1 hypothetical protein NESG_00471 [Nematocida ausubeli]
MQSLEGFFGFFKKHSYACKYSLVHGVSSAHPQSSAAFWVSSGDILDFLVNKIFYYYRLKLFCFMEIYIIIDDYIDDMRILRIFLYFMLILWVLMVFFGTLTILK